MRTKLTLFVLLILGNNIFADSGIVTADGLNIRSGPGAEYKVVQTVRRDTLLEIISYSGNWIEVSYNNSHGYVNINYVKIIKTPVAEPASVSNRSKLTLNSMPYIIHLVTYYPSQILGWMTDSGWVLSILLLAIMVFAFFSGIYTGVVLHEYDLTVLNIIPNIIFPIKIAVFTHFMLGSSGIGSLAVLFLSFVIIQPLSCIIYPFTSMELFPIYLKILKTKIGSNNQSSEMLFSVIKILLLWGVSTFILEILTCISMPFVFLGYFCHKNRFFRKIAHFFDDAVEEEARPWIDVETGQPYSMADNIVISDNEKYDKMKSIERYREKASEKFQQEVPYNASKYKEKISHLGVFTPDDYLNYSIQVDKSFDNVTVRVTLNKNNETETIFSGDYSMNSNSDITSQIMGSDICSKLQSHGVNPDKNQIISDIKSKL